MRSARWIVAASSVALSLVLAELLVRVVAPVSESRLLPFTYNDERVHQIIRGDTYLTYDADLGWNLTPSRTRRSEGNVYRINSQSIRADHDYQLDEAPGVQRITAFGDSFTHCSESTQQDCWTVLLEDALPRAEVLNFGVPGYGPDQALLRYGRDGQKFGGCAVIIGYFVGDIERVVNRFRPFIHPDDSVVLSKPRYVLNGSDLVLMPNPVTDLDQLLDVHWVESTLGQHDSWYFPNTFTAGPLDSSHLVRLGRTAAYTWHRQPLLRTERGFPLYDQQGEAYQLTQRILLKFVDDVRANGATPVVVVMPGMLDLAQNATGVKTYAPLLELLSEAGAPVVDVTSELLVEVERHGLDDVFEDTHYSRLGNAAVAQKLAETLPRLTQPTCGPAR
ncbi:MAG: hypothetical protein IT306_26910 [Chloroflexi bacterium]|nr:hypothetical protein [Chloroflexota bacterium]